MGGAAAIIGLGTIEPLAGAGFAMSLAYLALDRFRYRKDIEYSAHKALEKYDAEGDGTPDLPSALLKNEIVNELQWLCRKSCNGYTPKGSQIVLYRYLFRRQFDVGLITVLGAMSALTLALGVAFGLSRWQVLVTLDKPTAVGLFFYICFFAMAVPPFAIAAGRYITKWCVKRAGELDQQIAAMMTLGVDQVQAPPLPQGPSQMIGLPITSHSAR